MTSNTIDGLPRGSETECQRTRPRIAVVSPFVDKRHGTERCLAEQIERLSGNYEIHLFSSRVEDTDLTGIEWHRVPELPGSHLSKYLFWFAANHFYRWRERLRSGRPFDLVFSPGVNCLDAEVVLVHIVFAEFINSVRSNLKLAHSPPRFWPRLIHRRLYYRLIVALERRIYRGDSVLLAAVSKKTAEDLRKLRPGAKHIPPVVYPGIDPRKFDSGRRQALRPPARTALGLAPGTFALLLIGNDWKKKGLDCLLQAIGKLDRPEVRLLICGEDNPAPFKRQFDSLSGGVKILPIREDVEFYYSAADLLVAPSLEDAFSSPPIEAMGSGLPVIVSRRAGVSEIITHGHDGLVLEDPSDADELAGLIGSLLCNEELREKLTVSGVQTAQRFTWAAHAEQMRQLFELALSSEPAQVRRR